MGARDEENQKRKKNKKNNHGKKIITDARFCSVHSDPRFQKFTKRQSKVPIDSRFDRMFSDKNFSSSSSRLDKRGKLKIQNSENPLHHYYRLEEEEKGKSKMKNVKRIDNDDEEIEEFEDVDSQKYSRMQFDYETNSKSELLKSMDDSESNDDDDEEEKAMGLKKISRESPDSEKESESEPSKSADELENDTSSSTTDTDTEDEVYTEGEEEEPSFQEETIPVIEKETRRLAAVNMDWSQVKAADLYVVMSSFLPKGGQILSVAVYPSEFGLKRMEEEAVHGPIDLFDSDKEQSDDDNDDEIDTERLRAYEKSRLRYYYAVLECDSTATADYLYKACDGVEFERSSNVLDLRFIPDSMEFKHPPRDIVTEAPVNYEGLDFHTHALQHSKLHLSWDEDEPHRAKTLKRKFNADQLAELELNEFLASDEGDTDNDENDKAVDGERPNKRDMYCALVQSGDGSDVDGEDNNKDMEVTFNTGLEDISKRILEKKDKKSESVWDAYLRKRTEKKKARKNSSKHSSEDESSDTDQEAPEQPDDFFIEEPSMENSKKEARGKNNRKEKQRQGADNKQEATKAELELLLADDQGADRSVRGYSLKPKKVRGKKGKEVPAEVKLPVIDNDDPRFSAMFTSPLFALDPTDPQYKRSAAYARQLAQQQQKSIQEEIVEKELTKPPIQIHSPSDNAAPKEHKQLQSDGMSSKKEQHEISSLVRSIKKNALQVQKPSSATTSKKDDLPHSNGLSKKKEKDKLSTLVQSVKRKTRKLQS